MKTNYIPDDKVQDIKRAADIVEVISPHVQLKKSGKSFIGICPFHGGKSFNVSPDKNIFKCFGCGKGGDATSFIMQHLKISYPDALRYLAEQFHVLL